MLNLANITSHSWNLLLSVGGVSGVSGGVGGVKGVISDMTQ